MRPPFQFLPVRTETTAVPLPSEARPSLRTQGSAEGVATAEAEVADWARSFYTFLPLLSSHGCNSLRSAFRAYPSRTSKQVWLVCPTLSPCGFLDLSLD